MKAYQFKISLKHAHPPIWRRIVIPACMSFETFSDIIQKLFGFEGYHLAEFYFREMDIALQERYNPDSFHTLLVMGRHPLEEFETFRKFIYTYDFGDDWEFEIVREKILEDYPDNYPTLLKYKGDNLVEDCGGVYGYAQLKEAWENPEEADPNLLEWVGDKEIYDFEPEFIEMVLNNYTCDKDGKFVMPDGLDEEDNGEDDDKAAEEAYLREIRKALEEETLKKEAAENPEGTAALLLNLLTNSDDMEKLMNLERLPKNRNEEQLVVSYAVSTAFAHAAMSVSRAFGIPAEEVVDSFDLVPQERDTVKMMVEDAEADDDIPF